MCAGVSERSAAVGRERDAGDVVGGAAGGGAGDGPVAAHGPPAARRVPRRAGRHRRRRRLPHETTAYYAQVYIDWYDLKRLGYPAINNNK